MSSFSIADRPLPSPDRQSPTGYLREQHRLVLPSGGTDGYHWIMQTERMLAGDGMRIRRVSYDNPPTGREVHWSGSVRWWLASVAAVYRWFHPELSAAGALERVAPCAGALALAAFMLLFTPLLASRLGATSAALFALGCVGLSPFYQSSIVGFLDHHNLAAMSGFASVVFLVVAGAGWVRPRAGAADTTTLTQWPHDVDSARRWFIAAGAAAATGLWISAVTLLPILLAIGAAAIIGTGLLGHAQSTSAWRAEPRLWRVWGITGCVLSLALYLLEYFPRNFGFRLEVNHPLYALAWLGAGDLPSRVCGWLAGSTPSVTGDSNGEPRLAQQRFGRLPWPGRVWLLLDLVLIIQLPAVIALTAGATYHVLDPFLWALHADYVTEFTDLWTHFSALPPDPLLQSTYPVIVLPLAGLLWRTTLPRSLELVWRAMLLAVIACGLVFLHTLGFFLFRFAVADRVVAHVLALIVDTAMVLVLVVWPAREVHLQPPLQALLLIALLPAVALLAFSCAQIRWLGIESALCLASLVTVAAVLSSAVPRITWSTARTVRVAALLCLVLLPHPLYTVRFPWRFGYPPLVALDQLLTRDIAYLLRARLGEKHGVVVSGPTTTSWLVYYGGMRGLGTLYWENVDGLKAAAAIYGAPSAARARELIDDRGVTHLVICSWDSFVREYTRLARELEPRRTEPYDGFLVRLLERNELPPWLTRIPYELPPFRTLSGARVWIFEVTDRT